MKLSYDNIFKNLGIIIMLIYVGIVIQNPNLYHFAFDEIHSCNVAYFFNHFEIIKLMRAEGHTFLWYYLIKPFLSFDILFPSIIKILNLLFMVGAIALLWFRSPIPYICKFLIIFSYPFLCFYSTYARPYGMGIFLLFLLAALFNEKLKHPILYSCLLFLTANTCLMTFVGAGAFGILFLFDLIKEKDFKNLAIATTIALLTIVSLYIQWHDPIIPYYVSNWIFANKIKQSIMPINNTLSIKNTINTILVLIPFVTLFYFKKHLKALFFITYCWLGLFTIFKFLYTGEIWHHYFLYIYWIIAYWLSFNHIKDNSLEKKIFTIFFIFTACCLIFIKTTKLEHEILKHKWDYLPQKVLNITGNDANIYTHFQFNPWFVAFAKNYNVKEISGEKLTTVDKYLTIYKKPKSYSLLKAIENYPPNSYIVTRSWYINFATDHEEYRKLYKPIVMFNPNFYIYKIR